MPTASASIGTTSEPLLVAIGVAPFWGNAAHSFVDHGHRGVLFFGYCSRCDEVQRHHRRQTDIKHDAAQHISAKDDDTNNSPTRCSTDGLSRDRDAREMVSMSTAAPATSSAGMAPKLSSAQASLIEEEDDSMAVSTLYIHTNHANLAVHMPRRTVFEFQDIPKYVKLLPVAMTDVARNPSSASMNDQVVFDEMQQRYTISSTPTNSVGMVLSCLATELHVNQKVSKGKIACNVVLPLDLSHAQVIRKGPWTPPQICFGSWSPFSCCLDTVQQRQPWPPPLKFEVDSISMFNGYTASCVFDRGKSGKVFAGAMSAQNQVLLQLFLIELVDTGPRILPLQ